MIVIYLKKIEIECEAGCEDKTTYHSLLVLLDYVEACNKEDKDRVVAEAAAQFESWNLEVARTISTTKMETKVTVLTRVSVLHPIKVRFVTKFIAQQEEIAGLGNGDRPGQLRELIADEDFVPPQRSKLITCSMKAKIEPLKQAVICARQNVIIPTK